MSSYTVADQVVIMNIKPAVLSAILECERTNIKPAVLTAILESSTLCIYSTRIVLRFSHVQYTPIYIARCFWGIASMFTLRFSNMGVFNRPTCIIHHEIFNEFLSLVYTAVSFKIYVRAIYIPEAAIIFHRKSADTRQ